MVPTMKLGELAIFQGGLKEEVMSTMVEYFDSLNQEYLAVHRKKEELFWTIYMGTSDDQNEFAEAETRWFEFISDPQRLFEVRSQLKQVESSPDFERKSEIEKGLKGWLVLFEANVLETEIAQKMKATLIKDEAALFEKRKNYQMVYQDENGNLQDGSLPVMSSNIRASNDEQIRKSSHRALLDLEQWVLRNGYIDLVNQRNRFARELGYDNFFDYSVQKTEQMTTEELFAILDDFEKRTRKRNQESIESLQKQNGEQAVTGYNFNYSWGGDSIRELDPYVPFSKSLRRWVSSFARMNIDYQGAELTLDLLDREGKYQNGFCHGPVPSFFDNGSWIAAKVNFTSNCKPTQVGSGYDGIATLFHEGGHAAHFANITMNAPCFSQEFAPTSMALAETQSMFCDSLLADADWLKSYAKDSNSNSVPDSIIKDLIVDKQPFLAYKERSTLVVPYFERAVYLLDEHQVTAEKLTLLARETEQKILGLSISPRPLLSIPHLLSADSACSYQGYLLAHMAVYQSRAYFLEKFGYLTDNPNIGPLLAKHYWNPGNSLSHTETIRNLTGEGFNPKYLADYCNRTVDEAWGEEVERIEQMKKRETVEEKPLNAKITIVDGHKVLASNEESDVVMCSQFEEYLDKVPAN